MSFIEPEDEMRAMIEALGLAEPDPNTNVKLLTDAELVTNFGEITEQLKALGEVLRPRTEAGQALHSTRDAYMVTMRERGLR